MVHVIAAHKGRVRKYVNGISQNLQVYALLTRSS